MSVGLELDICSMGTSIISRSCSRSRGLTGVIINDVIQSGIFLSYSYTYLIIIKLPFEFKI